MSKLIQGKQHNKPYYYDPHLLCYELMKASDKIGAAVLSLTSQYSGICQCSHCYIFTKSLLLHFGTILAGCLSLPWFLAHRVDIGKANWMLDEEECPRKVLKRS